MRQETSSFVTKTLFKKEIKILHNKFATLNQKIDSSVARLDQKIDSSVARLDQKIDSTAARLEEKIARLSLTVINVQDRVTRIEENMATKSDIDRILSTVAEYAKNTYVVLQNQEVHRGYIHDHEARLIALEKPIAL